MLICLGPSIVRCTGERMTTIVKATILENIHQEFFTLINSITGIANNLYPAFPDKEISSKSSYPLFVLNSADIDEWEEFTLKKVKLKGTISVDIFTTSAKTCDEYTSDILDKIEGSAYTTRSDGLLKVKLVGMDKDQVQHGKIMVHKKSIQFEYEFIFTRSQHGW